MRILELTNLQDIRGTSARVNLQSLQVSTVELKLVCRDIQEPQPFAWQERVLCTIRGRACLAGLVTSCYPQVDGNNYYWMATISDHWWYIEETNAYNDIPDWEGISNPPSNTQGVYPLSPNVVQLGQIDQRSDPDSGNSRVPIMTVLSTLLSGVMSRYMYHSILLQEFEADMIPSQMSGKYGQVIRSVMSFAPGLTSTYNYTAYDNVLASGRLEDLDKTKPTLVIAENGNLDRMVLSYQSLLSQGLRPRYDLVPPAVGVVVSSKSFNGRPVWVTTVCPRQASLAQPCAVVAEFSEEATGGDSSLIDPNFEGTPEEQEEEIERKRDQRKTDWTIQTMEIKGTALPRSVEAAGEFVKRHAPWLEDHNILVRSFEVKAATSTGTEGKGYSKDAIAYELTEGQIGNRTAGLKWGRAVVTLVVYVQGRPPAEHTDKFPNVDGSGNHWGSVKITVVTTNRRRARWMIGGDYRVEDLSDSDDDDDDDDDLPPGQADEVSSLLTTNYEPVVDAYYAKTRMPPYQGQVKYRTYDLLPAIGKSLQVVGGRPEWETMQGAIVQTQSYEVETGLMTISTGPPVHLAIQDSTERNEDLDDLSAATTQVKQTQEDGSGGSDWHNEMPQRKRPQAPGIGPGATVEWSGYTPYQNADFAIRLVRAADGEVQGVQVRSGYVRRSQAGGGGFLIGNGDWNSVATNGPVYCNFYVNESGSITSGGFSGTPGENKPYIIELDKDKNPAPVQEPGSYSVFIGSRDGDTVYQSQQGPIEIAYIFGTAIDQGD